jgi:predicted amidohydrolase YtcJ
MSAPKPSMADLVLINGKIITADSEFSIAEAIAVKNSRIQLVGTTKKVKELVGIVTKVIDLEGKTVMPSLYDSHLHLVGTGAALRARIWAVKWFMRLKPHDIPVFICRILVLEPTWGNPHH